MQVRISENASGNFALIVSQWFISIKKTSYLLLTKIRKIVHRRLDSRLHRRLCYTYEYTIWYWSQEAGNWQNFNCESQSDSNFKIYKKKKILCLNIFF